MPARLLSLVLLVLSGFGFAAAQAQELLPYPIKGANGMYEQPWIEKGPLDLDQGLKQAVAQGKHLAVFWEQEGCHFCEKMHTENLRYPEIVEYITENFSVMQADMHARKTATTTDGSDTTERKLARQNRVAGTPTIQFLDGEGKEVFRMPGYAEPPVFLAVFEYVATKGYQTASFRTWVQEKIARMEREEKNGAATN